MIVAIVASWIFAAVLAVAGVRKLVAPAATAAALHGARLPSDRRLVRLLGLGEIVVGCAALLVGGMLLFALLALIYAAFALFAHRQARAGKGCGCFGEADAPATNLHVAINIAGAALGAVAAWQDGDALLGILGPAVVPAALTVVLLVAATVALRLAFTALPELLAAAALDDAGRQA